MKVALLIGHRASSQGARSVKKISEYAFFYTYLHTILPFLPQRHHYKVFERRDNDGRGYRERMRNVGRRAQDWGADMIISFHFNWSRSQKTEGFEVLCSSSTASRMYASALLGAFDDNLYGDNRGVKMIPNDPKVRGSGFLYKTPMTAILAEPFFGTSYEDFEKGTTGGHLTQALIDFFNRV